MDKLGAGKLHVGPRAAPTDGNNRRMLADQDDDSSIASARGVVSQPPLKRQAVFEVDDTEQVNVDGEFGREPRRRLWQRGNHSFSPDTRVEVGEGAGM